MTGNYGIGGAWVGPRMNYESLVVLPAEMSAERFEKIGSYGAQVVKTPGSESNVKEIYDKVNELRRDAKNKILNQFAEFGNYRFHYDVTGHAAQEVVKGVGNGKVAAFVSAIGSAGTIAAGDFLSNSSRIAGSSAWNRSSVRRCTTRGSARTPSKASATSTSRGFIMCGTWTG